MSELLAAFRNGNQDAGAEILVQLDTKFARLARRAATDAFRSDNQAGMRAGWVEDFEQDARLAAWECLLKFEGDSLDDFNAYAYRTVEHELRARSRAVRCGTEDDPDGKKLFAAMVAYLRAMDETANLDEEAYLSLAEAAVQDAALLKTWKSAAYDGRRLPAEKAHAARLAYQGTTSIDRPRSASEDDDTLISDTLATEDTLKADEIGYSVRSFIWHQAYRALETNLPLPKDEHLREAVMVALGNISRGNVWEEDIELLEDLPCGSDQVGTAVAMLRAMVEQRTEKPEATDAAKSAAAILGRGSIALAAQQDAQRKQVERVIRRALVGRVLDGMSDAYAFVLRATFAFEGYGKFKDDKAIAKAMEKAGLKVPAATRVARKKATESFTGRWVKVVAKNETERDALVALAQKQDVDLLGILTELYGD